MTATLDEAQTALSAPLGTPGSGRIRYGGAMALYQLGGIGPEVLEVYRICSPLDAEDPAVLLAERGLTAPLAPVDPALILRALVMAADGYLAALPGPGVAEVRAGLAAAIVAQPSPCTNTVVTAHVGAALAMLETTDAALAAAIADAVPHLGWITYDRYPRDAIGAAFADGHAFVALATGVDYELGLFLIAPHVLYRDHAHAAPELYAPLTGPHGWRFGPGTALEVKPAHDPVWNPARRPHATKVGRVPFLCLYGWTRDVREPAYVIPADDWPALEAMPL